MNIKPVAFGMSVRLKGPSEAVNHATEIVRVVKEQQCIIDNDGPQHNVKISETRILPMGDRERLILAESLDQSAFDRNLAQVNQQRAPGNKIPYVQFQYKESPVRLKEEFSKRILPMRTPSSEVKKKP